MSRVNSRVPAGYRAIFSRKDETAGTRDTALCHDKAARAVEDVAGWR